MCIRDSALRAQILRLVGYRTEVIEFVSDEHTPRNLMIRAIKTGANPDREEVSRYQEMLKIWGIEPELASSLHLASAIEAISQSRA